MNTDILPKNERKDYKIPLTERKDDGGFSLSVFY